MKRPLDDLFGGPFDSFDIDEFLRMLGGQRDDLSPRESLDYAFRALTAARVARNIDGYTRALANFGAAYKRFQESRKADRPTDPDRSDRDRPTRSDPGSNGNGT